jgi:hypothetical protein
MSKIWLRGNPAVGEYNNEKRNRMRILHGAVPIFQAKIVPQK